MTPEPSVVSASSPPDNAARARTKASSPVPRVALRVGEAAAALGISEDAFFEHVAGELRWIRRGALKLVPVDELRRWADREAERTLE